MLKNQKLTCLTQIIGTFHIFFCDLLSWALSKSVGKRISFWDGREGAHYFKGLKNESNVKSDHQHKMFNIPLKSNILDLTKNL